MQEVNRDAPEKLFASAPWMTETVAARIQYTLEVTQERLARNFEGEGRLPKSRVVRGVVQRLTAGKNGERIAASFLACVDPAVYKNEPILRFALNMLSQHGSRIAQVHLASRILSTCKTSSDFSNELVLFCLNSGITFNLPYSEILEESFLRIVGSNVLNYLRNYEPDDQINHRNQGLLNFLKRTDFGIGRTPSQMTRDANWGIHCGEVMAAIAWFDLQPIANRNKVKAMRLAGGKFRNRDSSLFDFMIQKSNLEPFFSSIHEHGAIVLQTHCTMRGLVGEYLRSLDLPLTLVSRVVENATRQGDFHICTKDSSEIAMNMVKLTKLHRKAPRVTRIFPDGPDSSDKKTVSIAGIEASVSMGAATLGWFARAPLFFADTVWTGEGFVIEFTRGPNLSSCSSIEEAHQEYLQFFSKCVTVQLKRSPRNFGKGTGILQELIKRDVL